MPQIYRRHTVQASPPPARPPFEFVGGNGNPNPRPYIYRRASGIPAQPQSPIAVDADDSIVLSDLIRTGETSRLRRRGAMRLDHAARPASGSLTNFLAPQQATEEEEENESPVFIGGVDRDDEYYGFGTSGGGGGQEWREWATEAAAQGPYAGAGPTGPGGMQASDLRDRDDNEQPFSLFCGAPIPPDQDPHERDLHWSPSILPSTSHSHSDTHTGASSPHHLPPTNGCGALIHQRAFPQKPRPVWVGKEEATDVVVSLDARYFDSAVVAKMMKSACGCIREGVGCAVCGNPLGTRYMPCQAASDGIFSAPNTSSSTPSSSRLSSISRPTRAPRAPHPSSPRYWNCRPARAASSSSPLRGDKRSSASSDSSNSKRFYVYTFFSDRVRSEPVHDWEEYEPPHHHAAAAALPVQSSQPPQPSQRRPVPVRSQTIRPRADSQSTPSLPASFLALLSPQTPTFPSSSGPTSGPSSGYTSGAGSTSRVLTASPTPISFPVSPIVTSGGPGSGLVPQPIRFREDVVSPRTRNLEDMFDQGMIAGERGTESSQRGEEMMLDADGVVVVDQDEDGEEGVEGDKGIPGR
ncbi:hypothetical protein EUX98_g1596 [Antrodiella citrinella]|uniref:Uncharacterized protein n=1 Tax=Antrodiella citrinella TaxID=2447956 RepID=A0A4S4N2K6_9APHY|nr:hypothetical protein EUX98_g1596 [Antrodiella citrinella]